MKKTKRIAVQSMSCALIALSAACFMIPFVSADWVPLLTAQGYYINPSAGAGGEIYPSDPVLAPAGSDFVFHFLPDAGNEVKSVTVDGQETAMTAWNKYIFEDVQAEHDILITFTSLSDVQKAELDIPAGSIQLVSFPYIPKDPNPESLFGDEIVTYDKTRFRIGTYDFFKRGYLEYEDDLKTIEPGKAYWFYAKNALQVSFDGKPMPLQYDAEIQLNAGWNMIAVPNSADYDWNDVEICQYNADWSILEKGPVAVASAENDLVYKKLWKWNGTTYEYFDASGAYDNSRYKGTSDSTMQPYAGYWIKAKESNVVLRFTRNAQKTPSRRGGLMAGKEKNWMEKGMQWMSPGEVVAEDNDSPPEPMKISGTAEPVSDESSGGSSSCFVDAVNFR